MSALLMYLKQPSCIYCAYLWLATLAVVNAQIPFFQKQEVSQPKPDELQILNEDTEGLHFLADQGNTNNPDSHQLTLDLNTVNKWIRLSEKNRVITNTDTLQSYPDHPDRFEYNPQVLCSESVCDRRCYWEIEWSGKSVSISVSYKSISRKGEGNECRFGRNDQSWSLICFPSSYTFRHNNIETDLPVESISSRVGVYVDHSAGTLSFYSISGDTMSLIHTVQTTFTQPLYPGFGVYDESSVKLC
ncbi:tripartite motif-containing protein 16-like protein isoform X14 [Ctenopharyngodon idella]|uniref:tripartite motif-containing protein 16-like protein isoform X14 n=1 Tax=Ctenopharyngodon idella TaxID=7959 RepID=UPI002230D605|nr:tripartite motif-containing protein 16-like protein isoform X14 [Ctenopharyngodon idella]